MEKSDVAAFRSAFQKAEESIQFAEEAGPKGSRKW